MKLDTLLKIASKGYPDDWIYEMSWDRKKKKAVPFKHSGDSLAGFVVRELMDTYDDKATSREQLDEAIRRMEQAVADLNGVLHELHVARFKRRPPKR